MTSRAALGSAPRAARVSLAVIARDEEAMLADCLASARDAVDEMVVLDTGSRDATRELARRAGARVVELAWPDDFAAARNAAVLETRGDWVLMLDADERLAPGAARALRKAVARNDFDCAVLRMHDASRRDASAADIVSGRARVGEPGPVARLFRRTDSGPFRGVVHEGLEDWIREHRWRVRPVDADIVHFGALPEIRRARKKSERNRVLLERRCQLEADSPLPYGYLAIEHLREGRAVEAAEVAERGWARLDWTSPPIERRTGERLAVVRAKLQLDAGDAAAALATLSEIVEYEGDRPSYALLGGVALEQLAAAAADGAARAQHLEGALSAYRQWRSLSGRVLSHCDVGGGPGFVALRLGTTLLQLHRFDEALAELERALALDPGDRAARLGRLEALVELGRGDVAGELPALVDERPDAWLLAAALAESTGALADVPAFVLEARRRLEAGWRAPHRAGRLLELVAAAAAAQGRAIASAGRMRAVGAWLLGSAAPADLLPWERPEARYLRRVCANLNAAGQREAVERLAACAPPALVKTLK